jgi:hypothetical protein
MLTAGLVLYGVDFQRLCRTTITVLIWGLIDYNDVFPDTLRHRTELCLPVSARVLGDGTPFMGLPVYRRFNGFDNECLYKPKPYDQAY